MEFLTSEKRRAWQREYYRRNRDKLRAYHRKYNKNHPQLRADRDIHVIKWRYKRQDLLNRIKAELGCCLCEEKAYPALDFHHKGRKDLSSIQFKTASISKLKKELRRCVVLCANCHRKLHAKLVSLPKGILGISFSVDIDQLRG